MRVNLITALHTQTPRDYWARMNSAKPECMSVAGRFDKDYWDGDRKYGYGGYKNDGRWKTIAAALIARYGLHETSSVLDLGCGQALLLSALKAELPNLRVSGIDISEYAIERSPLNVRAEVRKSDLRDPLPFQNQEFDLVISVNALHCLHVGPLFQSLREMERVGKNKWLVVESYRNESELTNLQAWALTCASFYDVHDWEWILNQTSYSGDHEFIFFE